MGRCGWQWEPEWRNAKHILILGGERYLVDVRIEGWLKGKGERRREKNNSGEKEENMGNKC
jgi:hypothetical protein